MKNIMITLVIVAFAHTSANAQVKNAANCGTNDNVVCKTTTEGTAEFCYKTEYAQNYPVCKGENGYYICCNRPKKQNNTNGRYKVIHSDAALNNEQAEQRMVCTKAAGSNIVVCTNVPLAKAPQNTHNLNTEYNHHIANNSRYNAYPY
jgi:hypothetical protein